MRSDERAVSEVVGFVLVFALIVTTVGVVYVSGFSGLENARDAERVNNAERAFDVLADNIADLYRGESPNRATELNLAESNLRFGEPTNFRVTITNSKLGSPTYSDNLDPIVYTAQGRSTEIVYENGAVIRDDQSGAIMQKRPPFVFTSTGSKEVAILPLIQTRSYGGASVAGSGTVLIRTELALSEVMNNDHVEVADETGITPSTHYEVEFVLETTPNRAVVWERYLENELESELGESNPCSVGDDTVTCSFDVDKLYVTATRIDATFT